jgi:hypothetical protein
VVTLMLVEPPVKVTQLFRELILPESSCPLVAPSTNRLVAPAASAPLRLADVLPRANLIRVCANKLALDKSVIDDISTTTNFLIFM